MRDAVRDWMRGASGGSDVADDARILDEGVLTSLQTLELVLFLEERFAISITDDELVEENFQSIEAIVDMVHRKLT